MIAEVQSDLKSNTIGQTVLSVLLSMIIKNGKQYFRGNL